MERWLNLKRKNSDVDDEKTPCTSKEKSTKLRKYDSNYLSMGLRPTDLKKNQNLNVRYVLRYYQTRL